MKTTTFFGAMAATLAITFVSACSNMDTGSTAAQADGLAPVLDTKIKEFYRRPGTDFSNFSRIGIESCEVTFRKNWQRNQNTNRTGISDRVTEKDVNRIKGRLSDSCNDRFRESFEQSTVYTLADNYSSGESVLILRPSIINLDVNAPDLHSAGLTQFFTKSAGEMTLSLDIVDGATGEVLARAVDHRRDHENIYFQPTSSVTNQAEFDRSLRHWAKLLRTSLDEAAL